MENVINEGLSYLGAIVASGPIQTTLLILKALFIALGIVLLFFAVKYLFKSGILKDKKRNYLWYFDTEKEKAAAGKDEWHHTWGRIHDRIHSATNDTDATWAVLEADALFGVALEEKGFGGENLTERLSYMTPSDLRNLADVLAAHRQAEAVRSGGTLSIPLEEARRYIDAYHKALLELGILTH